jgi:Ca-activated chloride channel family protein
MISILKSALKGTPLAILGVALAAAQAPSQNQSIPQPDQAASREFARQGKAPAPGSPDPRSPDPRSPDPRSSDPRIKDAGSDNAAPTFTVDVKLVNVFVTVTDENGAPVSSVEKEAFTLFENDVPQKIALFGRESEMPVSIVMCVDASLSTRKDLRLELVSAKKFVHAILRPVDAMALYQFTEVVKELVPFTSNMGRIDAGLDRVQAEGATALYDAIYLGSQSLLDRRGRKVLVVITDGGDTMSDVSYHAALRAAQEAEAIIYSVVIVPIEASAGRDIGGENALIQLSHDTGGKHYYASGQASLDAAFRQISQELRTQYLLGYYPADRSAESGFRRLRVEVKAPGENLITRHRTGYYSSKPR